MLRRRPAAITAAAVALATAMATAGCSSSPQMQVVAMVTAAPAGTPPADPAAQAQVVTGLDGFGLALFRKLGTGNGNLVLSPQSLTQVLTMLLPGARGTSATALESVLGYTGLGPDQAAYALGAQDLATEQRAVAGSDTLTEADDVWVQKGLTLQTPYLQTLSGAFRSGVRQPDFAADPAAAANQVNQQVSQETKGLIPQLFSPTSFDADTVLVLTDATYFKAPWQQSFDPGQTAPAGFTTATGSTAQVPMMNQTTEFGYATGPGWKAVQLPYNGGQLAMDVLLPDSSAPGSLAAYRNSLTVPGLTAMADAFTPKQVELSLPEFTVDSDLSTLSDLLQQMGLANLFTSSADLSGLFAPGQTNPPYVKTVVQKAHIEVSEAGTTAAAGSGVQVQAAAAAPTMDQVQFDANHPFVYVIRDVISGQILFLGQVADPS
ncbi:MAG TPA: serpin family protein [Actinocrinis sp.]|nr:serpin family protein [Actinocrinis sp.]